MNRDQDHMNRDHMNRDHMNRDHINQDHMNQDMEGTHVSEHPVSGHDEEPASADDRSALAEDDIDFAEAFKLATGRCPLGVPPGSAQSDGEAPVTGNPA